MTERGWVVVVDETRINAVGGPLSRWWAEFQLRMGDRIEWRDATLGGGVAQVLCDDRAHARWLAARIGEMGAPKGTVEVVRR